MLMCAPRDEERRAWSENKLARASPWLWQAKTERKEREKLVEAQTLIRG